MQMFVSLRIKFERSHVKEKIDEKYDFWPFYIICNINMQVLSASLFVLLNECTLADCRVHILMLCLCWTPSWLLLLRLVDWQLYSGLDWPYFCVK